MGGQVLQAQVYHLVVPSGQQVPVIHHPHQLQLPTCTQVLLQPRHHRGPRGTWHAKLGQQQVPYLQEHCVVV